LSKEHLTDKTDRIVLVNYTFKNDTLKNVSTNNVEKGRGALMAEKQRKIRRKENTSIEDTQKDITNTLPSL
jgi:hypothetical protein